MTLSRLLSVLILLSLTLPAVAAEPAPAPGTAPAPPPGAAIPVADVATQAAELSNVLRTLTAPLGPSAEIETIRRILPEVRRQIELELAAAATILKGQPSLDMLQTQQQLWHRRQLQTAQWLRVLTERATLLSEALTRLADLQQTWRQTLDAARAARAPGPIVQQINTARAAIEATETPLRAQQTAVLELQSLVGQEVARTETALAQFTQAQQQAVGGILTRNRSPLWRAEAWAEVRATLLAHLREDTAGRWADIVQYVRDPSQGMPLHVGIIAVLGVALSAAGRLIRRWSTTLEGPSTATSVFDRPFTAAVVIALLAVAGPYSSAPPSVRSLFEILGLAAAIRLTRLTTDARLAPELYMLWVLFAIDSLRVGVTGAAAIEQVALALGTLAGIAVTGYSLSLGGFRRASAQLANPGRLAAFSAGTGLVMVVFLAALVAAVLGYMRVARLLFSGALGSGALALMLYAGIQVLDGVIAFILRLWPFSSLQIVQHHRSLLERRIHNVLVVVMAGGWVIRTLNYVGLLETAYALGAAVLTTELGRGTIRTTLGDLLEFVLTVWLAYLVSAFIRFVLREDIYPRTTLSRGRAYAISSLLNYAIVLLGFLLGLGVLGLDITKVTILVGAFGVGIGFGLQSVVNNFVSGLILLFERPIQVGDIVEVGSIAGEVSRIGMRASTVRTWQGAEVIVPNAQLVTDQVTNWTLSDRKRRIDLPVGVDYGSAPEKVVEVLEEVARGHPQVLKDPAPQAVFLAFGDSSINFELRAWTNRFERWQKIQTELAGEIYAALHAAGMKLPFPQREVRVLNNALTESDKRLV